MLMDEDRIAFRCPTKLLEKIDAYIETGEYMNRGDAGRDLVRLGIQMKEESKRNEKKQMSCDCDGVSADGTTA
jgi:Arc/MetJ-type ribon-helix-helix transcriptional regulator